MRENEIRENGRHLFFSVSDDNAGMGSLDEMRLLKDTSTNLVQKRRCKAREYYKPNVPKPARLLHSGGDISHKMRLGKILNE